MLPLFSMARFEFDGLILPDIVLDSSIPFDLVIDFGTKPRCRKSTCPPILPFRHSVNVDNKNDSDSDIESESDEDIDIVSDNFSESTIGDEDFTDDEPEADKPKCSGTIVKRKRVAKSVLKPTVQQIIEKDVLLQLQPRVNIYYLPSYMIDSDNTADELIQIMKVLERNMFKSMEYVVRHFPNTDDDDDYLPNLLPSKQLPDSRKRGFFELNSDDEDDIQEPGCSTDNFPVVVKKRARMSLSKPRKRVVVPSSDSDSDDLSDDEDIDQIILESDAFEEDDDENELTEGRETETEEMFMKKRKRKFSKRVHRMITLSSDDEAKIPEAMEEELLPEQESAFSSQKSDRKEIRRVLSEAELEKATKEATSIERKRKERINELKQNYDKILPEIEKGKEDKRLILDIDLKTKQVRVEVNQTLVKYMKPHQFEGLKFMYYSTIESIDKITEEGSGCILAHCMGLGKTLQVISFVQTLLTNEFTKKQIRTILILVPVNTLKNWSEEFDKWINKKMLRTFDVYELIDETDNRKRAISLTNWHKNGGVMITGMPVFASLLNLKESNKKNLTKYLIDAFTNSLSDPGPDVLIVDEGHLLKNISTKICKAVEGVRTRRKIMLTGTPLQNNLTEYRTMVNIIKPRLLGSAKEFANRFRNPIENGQKADSNARDVSLMKKRAMILHKLLDGCIQRFGHDTLKPFLQPKTEYALYIRPSVCMAKMYNHYLDQVAIKRALLWDATKLRLCTNHPALYYMAEKNYEVKKAARMSKRQLPGDLRPIGEISQSGPLDLTQKNPDIVNGEASSSNGLIRPVPPPNEIITNDKTGDKTSNDTDLLESEESKRIKKDWFKQFVKPDDWKNIELSGKLVMLFKILKKCIALQEKLLVVSQSLETLDLIEKCLMLNKEVIIDDEIITLEWVKGRNYFRIDGQTDCFERTCQVKQFNNPNNTDARLFLLSTKAGGVGINLFGATRCIIFDVSWNPSDDIQAIFRIYRLGQSKPVFVYRFIAKDSMEEKIFRKQIMKLGMAIRVLDQAQVKRNFKSSELEEFYTTRPGEHYEIPVLKVPADHLLADLLLTENKEILDCKEFDSLLEKKPEDDLTEDERQAAWAEYQKERDAEIQAAEERKQQIEAERTKAQLEELAVQNRIVEELQPKSTQHSSNQPISSNIPEQVPDSLDSDALYLSQFSDIDLTKCSLEEFVRKLLSLDENKSSLPKQDLAEYLWQLVAKVQTILTRKLHKLKEKARVDLLSETEIMERITYGQSLKNLMKQIDAMSKRRESLNL